ncbi:F-box protein At5g07610 [Lactuca sativa]|uniref:F-box domain-containing protein n=1 Tax=Lactuca sativa TaxID=4236 RepID=A0A9R1UIW1_LACSA|nr:F-box protein At5g07610 [Lactuca sativa]KAJ0187830.1 hypothetical protein LSAT_V11C900477580 [Lactuca sativa]
MKTHALSRPLVRGFQPTQKMVNTSPTTKKTRNQSGALIGSNDDLLIEILLRLPVISVVRFKSVSKHWLSLLSQRPFTLMYKNVSISPGFYIHNKYIPFDVDNQIVPLEIYPHACGIRIVQSCNGLLLCCTLQRIQERKYYVFNPTTKQIAFIPSIPGGRNVRNTITFMGLAFHQTDCVHYKVVCFHHAQHDEKLFQIQIYSSDARKWKISDESFSFSAPYYESIGSGVYWNQAIYWAPFSATPLYFKIDTEELQSLSFPIEAAVESLGGGPNGAMRLYFGESRGHLHLVVKADRSETHLHLNVYEMLNDCSGWFVKYRLDLDELLNSYPEISTRFYKFQVLDVVRGEEEDETFMVFMIPGNKIIRYNVADKSCKQIYDLWLLLKKKQKYDLSSVIDGPIEHSEVHRYIETIVSF